jgi:dynein heavy chain
LYDPCSFVDIRETEEDKSNFERLQNTKSQFDTAVFIAESSIPTNTEKFSKDLEAKIPILQEDVIHIVEQLKADLIANPAKDHEEVIQYLSELEEQLDLLEKTAVKYRKYQETLGVEPTQFDALRDARTDLDIKLSLWRALKRWSELTEEWISEKFERIDADEIQRQVIQYSKVYSRANRHPGMQDNPMVPILLSKIQEFKETLPVVSDLRNKDLQRHHWEEINKILGHDLRTDTEASLGTLLKLSAMAHKQDIAVIANKATNEAQLREKLGRVIDVWENHIFLPVNPYRESKEYFVLGGLDEILEKLDDSLVNISEIMGSHYVEPMRELVVEWSNKLTLFQHTLTQWTAFQRQWMYLESIFSSQDIAVELKEQKTDFDRVDRAWREIMRRTADSSKAIVAGCVPGLRDNFETYNEILEKINKALENFLEKKRRSFARFYFLATDDLLKILRESRNPLSVQPHLSKCFDNIERLEFADKDINVMLRAFLSCVVSVVLMSSRQ